MQVRILVLLFMAVVLIGNASAESGGLSITDFTMHKVVPTQDIKPVTSGFNASTEIKQAPIPAKTTKKTAKTVKQPVTNPAKSAAQPSKPAPKPNEDVKVTLKEIKTDNAPVEKIAKEDSKEEMSSKEAETSTYFEKLNKHLENNRITPDSEVAGKTDLKKYNHYDYIIKPTFSLGIVLVLILILAWAYNRLKGLNPNALLSGRFKDMDVNQFKVLASSSLGQGKIIHLVEINGKQLVIGSTSNNINVLTEINPEEMEKLKAKADRKTRPEQKTPQEEQDEFEGTEPESYSARYSEIYKDYLDKE